MTQYPSVGSPMFYGIFFIAVLIMIAIDMVSLKKNGAHKVSIKEALAWSGIWVAVSCAFAGWLYFELAGNPAYGAVAATGGAARIVALGDVEFLITGVA